MRFHLPDGVLKRADADLTDVTDSVRCGEPWWDMNDWLVLPLDPEAPESDRDAIRRRICTEDAADEERLALLIQARANPGIDPAMSLWLDERLAAYGEAP